MFEDLRGDSAPNEQAPNEQAPPKKEKKDNTKEDTIIQEEKPEVVAIYFARKKNNDWKNIKDTADKKLEFNDPNRPVRVVVKYKANKNSIESDFVVEIREQIPAASVKEFDGNPVVFVSGEKGVFDNNPVKFLVDGKQEEAISIRLKKGTKDKQETYTALSANIVIRPKDPKDFGKISKKITERFDTYFKNKNDKEKHLNTSKHSTFLYIKPKDGSNTDVKFDTITNKLQDASNLKDKDDILSLYECELKTEDKLRTHFILHCTAEELPEAQCVSFGSGIVNLFIMRDGKKIWKEPFTKHKLGGTKLESNKLIYRKKNKDGLYEYWQSITTVENGKTKTTYKVVTVEIDENGKSNTPIFENSHKIAHRNSNGQTLLAIKVNYLDYQKGIEINYNANDLFKEFQGRMFHIEINYQAMELPKRGQEQYPFNNLESVPAKHKPTKIQYDVLADLYYEAHNVLLDEMKNGGASPLIFEGDDSWPIIVPHIEIDRGFFDTHRDPPEFDFNYFYDLLKSKKDCEGNSIPENRLNCFFNHDRYWNGTGAPFREPSWEKHPFSWPPTLSGNPSKKAEDNAPAKCMVYFRPQANYNGEYGFDWIRNTQFSKEQKELNDNYDTKTACKNFGQLQSKWFSKELTVDGFEGINEYVPVLSVMKGKPIKLRAYINLKINGGNEIFDKKLLRWGKYDEKLFKLPKLSDLADPSTQTTLQIKEFPLECLETFSEDKEIEVLYGNNSTCCGKLRILKNKNAEGKDLNLDVVLVEVVADLSNIVEIGTRVTHGIFSANDLKILPTILKQAGISCNQTKTSLDISTGSTRRGFWMDFAKRGKINEDHDKLIQHLNSKLDKKYDKYYKIYYINEECTNGKDWVAIPNLKGGIVFKDHLSSTILRCMELENLSEEKDFPFTASKTNNLMDNAENRDILKSTSFVWQWEKLRKLVQNLNNGQLA